MRLYSVSTLLEILPTDKAMKPAAYGYASFQPFSRFYRAGQLVKGLVECVANGFQPFLRFYSEATVRL